jgi:hypothetical protein
MDRNDFLLQLKAQFPDAYSQIDEYESGLLHCEMGAFRRWVEGELSKGGEWNCEKAFKFVEECLKVANSDLENAIEVSFIEDLALGEHELKYKKIIKERAPALIKEKMIEAHEYWK